MENPQAFPFIQWQAPNGMVGISDQKGMTLRDYFSGQVLSGNIRLDGADNPHILAAKIYEIADAMLKERLADKA